MKHLISVLGFAFGIMLLGGCYSAQRMQDWRADIDQFVADAQARPQPVSAWLNTLPKINVVGGLHGISYSWLTSVIGRPDETISDGRTGYFIIYRQKAINDITGHLDDLCFDYVLPQLDHVSPILCDATTGRPLSH